MPYLRYPASLKQPMNGGSGCAARLTIQGDATASLDLDHTRGHRVVKKYTLVTAAASYINNKYNSDVQP
jgi:hypothetical protein